ncbi:uncharacterized protein LOC125493483 [Beta vulgaris subsp. vulgaris]|uniref:uncharacterized protein LOC125493483 n=1 Tax=Beta vulgaris subsp. vulgaris TaxID=3555 RepID=UPI002036C734|nr:uncharacterized protein LOC125493483 [Beta vulgaris subsp. vulgaris]
MARLHQTARKRTARKLTGPLSASPYLIRMRYGEDICDYVHRLNLAIESYHFNDLYGDSDFCTREKKAYVLLTTQPERGPLGAIKRKYNDVYVNDAPNVERYTHKGSWFLTIEYLRRVMIDAMEEYYYNLNVNGSSSDEGEANRSPNPTYPQSEMEDEEPMEDDDL